MPDNRNVCQTDDGPIDPGDVPIIGEGGYRVEISPPDMVYEGREFAIKVTALSGGMLAQVTGYTANTLNLDDASSFPASGSGFLKSGSSYRQFSWTGKSGNQLTGVSGHGTPAVGASAYALLGKDASYSGAAKILAQAGGRVIGLDDDIISSSDWSSGVLKVAKRYRKAVSNPNSCDAVMDIVIREQGTPSTGRTGAGKVLLRKKAGYFLIDMPASLTSEDTFVMKVTALNEDDSVNTSYAQDCTISHNGSGTLDITSISSGSWSSGVYSTSSQKYTSGESNKVITFTVREDGGTKSGSHESSIGPTIISIDTGSGMFTKYGSEPGWEDSYLEAILDDANWTNLQAPGSVAIGQLQSWQQGQNTTTYKKRGVLRFDVSAYKGSVKLALLSMWAKTSRYEQGDTTSYWPDMVIVVYSRDLGSSPTADQWEHYRYGRYVTCFLASQLAPNNIAESSQAALLIPASHINGLSGDHLGLFFVDAQESSDAMMPNPEGSVISAQKRYVEISASAKLYLFT